MKAILATQKATDYQSESAQPTSWGQGAVVLAKPTKTEIAAPATGCEAWRETFWRGGGVASSSTAVKEDIVSRWSVGRSVDIRGNRRSKKERYRKRCRQRTDYRSGQCSGVMCAS